MIKLKPARCLGLILALSLILVESTPVLGQTAPCPTPSSSTNNEAVNGLVTTNNLQNSFTSQNGTTSNSNCITGTNAEIAQYKLPSYDDLKSLYYTQLGNSTCAAPPSNSTTISTIPSPVGTCTGSVSLYTPSTAGSSFSTSITSALAGGGYTGVVFIDGDLTIGPISGNQLIYGSGTTGLVIVAKGNINIDKTVTRVDAVLISGGQICTAYDSSDSSNTICPGSHSGTPYTGINTYITPVAGQSYSTTPLTINGSLISLTTDPRKAIKFSRILFDNSVAAEQVNTQPKYLAILKTLFTQPYILEEDTTGQPTNGINGGTCTPNCTQLPSQTTCGQAISDGCGGTCGTGTLCTQSGYACVTNSCVPVANLSFSLPGGQITSSQGGTVNLSWTNIPYPSTNDEIAIYAVGASGTSYLLHEKCGTGASSGSCSFVIPAYTLPDGAYVFSYITGGNYSTAATSSTPSSGSQVFQIVN